MQGNTRHQHVLAPTPLTQKYRGTGAKRGLCSKNPIKTQPHVSNWGNLSSDSQALLPEIPASLWDSISPTKTGFPINLKGGGQD